MGEGGSLPYSMARGGRVYLMDPVLAFIVPSSEAVKLSEESLGVQHGFVLFFPLCCVCRVFDGRLLFGAGKNGPLVMDLPSSRVLQLSRT